MAEFSFFAELSLYQYELNAQMELRQATYIYQEVIERSVSSRTKYGTEA